MTKPFLKLVCLIALFVSLSGTQASAQGTAGTSAKEEPRYLFNMPTAGVLQRGAYAIEGWAYGGGGSFVSLSVGLSKKLTFGIAYGAGNLIGSGTPDWNELPGVMIRYRIFEEKLAFPAVTLGFESQGRENFLDDADRFERKSPGFFAAASKNYALLGFITFHGGINYSLENDDDKDLNFYFGVEKTIGSEISAYAQYDAAINDNNQSALGDGHGYLDMGLRWSLGKGMTIELNLSNISDNFKQLDAASRSFRLEYLQRFN